MEEKFLAFYNFVAVAKTRCSGECYPCWGRIFRQC